MERRRMPPSSFFSMLSVPSLLLSLSLCLCVPTVVAAAGAPPNDKERINYGDDRTTFAAGSAGSRPAVVVEIVDRADNETIKEKVLFHPFWDFQNLPTNQKKSLFERVQHLQQVSSYIDWDKLRDDALLASMDSPNRNRRNRLLRVQQQRLPHRRLRARHQDKDWESIVEDTLERASEKGYSTESSSTSTTTTTTTVTEEMIEKDEYEEVVEDVEETFAKSLPSGDSEKRSGIFQKYEQRKEDSKPGSIVFQKVEEKGSLPPKDTTGSLFWVVDTNEPEITDSDIDMDSGSGGGDFLQPDTRQGDDLAGIDDDVVLGANGGKPFRDLPIYDYNLGNCPGAGDSAQAVPCAPDNLNQICDKYEEGSAFSLCYAACLDSFCCIHDAPTDTNSFAPNCNTDVNCAQYAYCYIVWWKLHDTIGPATQLRVEQNDDFYDVPADFIQGDVTNIEFFREMLFHHFDDANEIIRLGTTEVNGVQTFDSDLIFLDPQYWNTTI